LNVLVWCVFRMASIMYAKCQKIGN